MKIISKWMELETIILSEVTQTHTQKNVACFLWLMDVSFENTIGSPDMCVKFIVSVKSGRHKGTIRRPGTHCYKRLKCANEITRVKLLSRVEWVWGK